MSSVTVFGIRDLLEKISMFDPNLAMLSVNKHAKKTLNSQKLSQQFVAAEFERLQFFLDKNSLFDLNGKIRVNNHHQDQGPHRGISLESLDETNTLVKQVAEKIIKKNNLQFYAPDSFDKKTSKIFILIQTVQKVFAKEKNYFSNQLVSHVTAHVFHGLNLFTQQDEIRLLFKELLNGDMESLAEKIRIRFSANFSFKSEMEETGVSIAQKYVDKDQSQKAQDILKTIDPASDVRLPLAQKYIEKDQCQKAIDILEDIHVSKCQYYIRYLGGVILSLVQKGHFNAAEKYLNKFNCCSTTGLSADLQSSEPLGGSSYSDLFGLSAIDRYNKSSQTSSHLYHIIQELVDKKKFDIAIRIIKSREPKSSLMVRGVVSKLLIDKKVEEALAFINASSQEKIIRLDSDAWDNCYSYIILNYFTESSENTLERAIQEFKNRLSEQGAYFSKHAFLQNFIEKAHTFLFNAEYQNPIYRRSGWHLQYFLFRVMLTDPNLNKELSKLFIELSSALNIKKETAGIAYLFAQLIPEKAKRKAQITLIQDDLNPRNLTIYDNTPYTKRIEALIAEEKLDQALEIFDQLCQNEYLTKLSKGISIGRIIAALLLQNTDASIEKAIHFMKDESVVVHWISSELKHKNGVEEILKKIQSKDKAVLATIDQLYKQLFIQIKEPAESQSVKVEVEVSGATTNQKKNEPTLEIKAPSSKNAYRFLCGSSYVQGYWQKSVLFKIAYIFSIGIIPSILFLYGSIAKMKYIT